MVFGTLALVTPGAEVEAGGHAGPVASSRGADARETDWRSDRRKGDRDLLVALGLLSLMGPDDLDEFVVQVRRLRPELRHAVHSNLTILSLLEPRAGMPDPTHQRREVSALLGRLERAMGAGS